MSRPREPIFEVFSNSWVREAPELAAGFGFGLRDFTRFANQRILTGIFVWYCLGGTMKAITVGFLATFAVFLTSELAFAADAEVVTRNPPKRYYRVAGEC